MWRLDQVLGRWARVDPRARARPGEVLLAAAGSGGYDPELGFDPYGAWASARQSWS